MRIPPRLASEPELSRGAAPRCEEVLDEAIVTAGSGQAQ